MGKNEIEELHNLLYPIGNDEILLEPDCLQHQYDEIVLGVQEWGIKNVMRLFGITINEYGEPDKNSRYKPRAKAFFTDTHFKNMTIIFFELKQSKSFKVSVLESNVMGKRTQWPIKFARIKNFANDHIDPVYPLCGFLVEQGIILPFKSQLKKKEWDALPFEDAKGLKQTASRI
jgi:hypothetical protein